ncbi:MAG: hypothetical protein EBT95_08050 [Verrucomicrobia bacterium]|nr:hypothetical protein [Verrucomicrobiota bacterium]
MRLFFTVLFLAIVSIHAQNRSELTRVPVVFSGGHETDPRDHGRPVVLIAGALGVSRSSSRSGKGTCPSRGTSQ